MKKIEPNMYVRTTNGGIIKVLETDREGFKVNNNSYYMFDSPCIIKASYKIIDLIEVGDYVNGELIEDITGEYLRLNGQSHNKHYFSKQIKSIVTKEQFEEMKYEIK